MARKYHTQIREEKAVEFRVTVTALEDYKNAWLVITNNAREYPETFYQIRNNSHSDIYVLCSPNSAGDIGEFLSQFGELERNDEEKIAVFVDVECEYDDFDEDYIESEYVFGELD